MSKVEIVGPRQQLPETLALVRRHGGLHIEPSGAGFVDAVHKKEIHSLLPDEKTVFEKIFLEKLETKLEELFSCLAADDIRESFLSPLPIIDTVSRTLDGHLEMARSLCRTREEMQRDLLELGGYRTFLASVSTLLDKIQMTPDLEYIGISLKDDKSVAALHTCLECLADASCEIITVPAGDGSLVGLIAATRDLSENIRSVLNEKNMPEFTFPESIRQMNFARKVEYLQKEISNKEAALAATEIKLRQLGHRWGPVYKAALDWVREKLSIIHASAFSFETAMCFFIYGWLPTERVSGLRESLQRQFSGSVMLQEIDMQL